MGRLKLNETTQRALVFRPNAALAATGAPHKMLLNESDPRKRGSLEPFGPFVSSKGAGRPVGLGLAVRDACAT